ncbi:hypothetical protein Scep_020022 [Stephania cephalantha]|uniref:NAC domain-containing protein n=1 Tax=Stephania cephalantha TaxID=152367 RepID=A0AAP0ICB3_9MAGN
MALTLNCNIKHDFYIECNFVQANGAVMVFLTGRKRESDKDGSGGGGGEVGGGGESSAGWGTKCGGRHQRQDGGSAQWRCREDGSAVGSGCEGEGGKGKLIEAFEGDKVLVDLIDCSLVLGSLSGQIRDSGEVGERCLHEKKGRAKEWYFFSRVTKKHGNGSRLSRSVAGQKELFWRASTGEKKIGGYNGQLLGKRTTLNYYEGKDSKTDWIMQEYILLPPQDHLHHPLNSKFEDQALCKIYKNNRNKDATTSTSTTTKTSTVLD